MDKPKLKSKPLRQTYKRRFMREPIDRAIRRMQPKLEYDIDTLTERFSNWSLTKSKPIYFTPKTNYSQPDYVYNPFKNLDKHDSSDDEALEVDEKDIETFPEKETFRNSRLVDSDLSESSRVNSSTFKRYREDEYDEEDGDAFDDLFSEVEEAVYDEAEYNPDIDDDLRLFKKRAIEAGLQSGGVRPARDNRPRRDRNDRPVRKRSYDRPQREREPRNYDRPPRGDRQHRDKRSYDRPPRDREPRNYDRPPRGDRQRRDKRSYDRPPREREPRNYDRPPREDPRFFQDRSDEGECVEQFTKKYTVRASPPYPANACMEGTVKKGNDGLMYITKADKNGVNRWYKYKGEQAQSGFPATRKIAKPTQRVIQQSKKQVRAKQAVKPISEYTEISEKFTGYPECVAQTTAKYTNRDSPAYPANKCQSGLIMRGKDGKTPYVTLPDKNGVNRWYKLTVNLKKKLDDLRARGKITVSVYKPGGIVPLAAPVKVDKPPRRMVKKTVIKPKAPANGFVYTDAINDVNYRVGDRKLEHVGGKTFSKAEMDTKIFRGSGTLRIQVCADGKQRCLLMRLKAANGGVTYGQFFASLNKFIKNMGGSIDDHFVDHVTFAGFTQHAPDMFAMDLD